MLRRRRLPALLVALAVARVAAAHVDRRDGRAQRVAAAEKALNAGDLKDLGKILYEHKMSEVKITQHSTELSKKLESLVQQAESKLVEA